MRRRLRGNQKPTGFTAFSNVAKAELLASAADAKEQAANAAMAELLASVAKAESDAWHKRAAQALPKIIAAEKQSSEYIPMQEDGG